MKNIVIAALAVVMVSTSVFADNNKTSYVGEWKTKFSLGHNKVTKNALKSKKTEDDLKEACKKQIALAHEYKDNKHLNKEFDQDLMDIYISDMKTICSNFACSNCIISRPLKK